MTTSQELNTSGQVSGEEIVNVTILEGAGLSNGEQVITNTPSPQTDTASKGEIIAWASYDIANATYGTVVATAIYNAYFVNTICAPTPATAWLTNMHLSGTVLLTLVICLSALTIVVTAPVVGTIADATASKKKLLLISTALCIICTTSLGFIEPGQVLFGMLALYFANTFFGTGEDLIASFLPELTTREHMGRVSAIGWAAGYVGSLIALGLSFAFIETAKKFFNQTETQYVPETMLICAGMFALFSIPTFVWLKERAKPDPEVRKGGYLNAGFKRLAHTFSHARHYRDLFNFLLTLFVYSCGTTTVIHLASVYAQAVLHFTSQESILMVLLVSVTAAIGAGVFGFVQDKIGSIRTIGITLGIWTFATIVAIIAQEKWHLWVAANFVGIAMGATGSAGRALVGQFSPPGRSGEFLGLWGVAHKLATAVGALTFGSVAIVSGDNFRIALVSCVVFFILGFALLLRVNEERGRKAAVLDAEIPI
jgi:UMF1 family MFS transporter